MGRELFRFIFPAAAAAASAGRVPDVQMEREKKKIPV